MYSNPVERNAYPPPGVCHSEPREMKFYVSTSCDGCGEEGGGSA